MVGWTVRLHWPLPLHQTPRRLSEAAVQTERGEDYRRAHFDKCCSAHECPFKQGGD